MPTGYTADIEKGITFQQFAMNCARAFGALISMRDEPFDAPIPEAFEPTDYHSKAITAARARQEVLEGMTPAAAQLSAENEYREAAERFEKYRQEKRDLRVKYDAMLAQVNAWQPPTSEHQGLKDFMVEQINRSMGDCTIYEDLAPKLRAGAEWLAAQQAGVKRDIEYHSAEHLKELTRVNGRTEWVKALRESLS